MFLPWLKNLSPFSKLTLFTLLFLIVSIFAAVSMSLTRQTLTSGAWYTSQSASVLCQNDKVKIKITFTNREPAGTSTMNVIATVINTGQKIDMGEITGGETKNVEVLTNNSYLPAGTIMYALTKKGTNVGLENKTAGYPSINCSIKSQAHLLGSPPPLPSPPFPPTANNTTFVFELLLHGIGNGGDNANLRSKGNFDIVDKNLKLTIAVHDSYDKLVLNRSGELAFSSASGSFKGVVDMGAKLSSGGYIIKVKAGNYLRTTVPGLVNVVSGTANKIPMLSLTAGDINNDNLLNILDYNALSACYKESNKTQNCNHAKDADLNRDSAVNLFDFNLFLRELSTKPGE